MPAVFGTRVRGNDLAVLDPVSLLFSHSLGVSPHVAWSGLAWVSTWSTREVISFRIVQPDGGWNPASASDVGPRALHGGICPQVAALPHVRNRAVREPVGARFTADR